jgi:DNA-binding IclR family transcriptional regulator
MAPTRSTSPPAAGAGSIDKAIDVLFHLQAQPAPQGVSAMGRALGLPKSSVHRLLGALARRGLVERDERGLYRMGVGLVALGQAVLDREPALEAARPVLQANARASGETFFFVAARGGRLVVLDQAEGDGFLRAAPRVGAAVPVFATAVGKLYRAFAPDEVDWPAGPEPFTDRTLPDMASFDRAATHARRRGFARNRDEWIRGLDVVAAPVRLADRLAGAVAMAGASSGMRALGDARARDLVIAAAHDIEAKLVGGAPSQATSLAEEE